MRIDRLDLTRFGNFTDHTVDLSAPGLHVVIGANEAGKTTAMQAIRQLFYGIPVQTRHAFLHEMPDLRIAAALRDGSDTVLEIVRLKKNKDPLRDPDDNTMAPETLARMLHDVDEAVFATLFTIGHDEIAAGGEALLASDGEVGKAIFSASRGTTDLTAVLRTLDEQAGEIFKYSASKPKLNSAIREYKESRSEANDLAQSSTAVAQLDADLRATRTEHDEIDEAKKALRHRTSLLEEIRSNRPRLATRHDHKSRQSELEHLGPLVDPTRGETLAAAHEQRKTAQNSQRAAESAIQRRDEKLGDLSVDSELIDQREAIEQLQSDVGGYHQNLEDLPGLQANASSLQRELEQLHGELPSGDLLTEDGSSNLSADQSASIEEFAQSRATLQGDVDHASQEVSAACSSLEQLQDTLDDLDDPADVGTLAEVCARVRKEGTLEDDRTQKSARLTQLDGAIGDDLSALGLSDVEPRTIGTVHVPSLATIRQVRDETRKLSDRTAVLDTEIAKLEVQRSDAATELEKLLGTDQPPSVEELGEARSRREAGWRLIRKAWLDGDENHDQDEAETWSEGQPLDAAYERSVATTDDIADRLRIDAGAVAQRTTLEVRITDTDADLQALRQEWSDVAGALETADAAWRELWEPASVSPGSPAEMEGWRDQFRDCRQRAGDATELDGEIARLDGEIARHRDDLLASLDVAGVTLPDDLSLLGLLDHAEEVADRATRAAKALADEQKAVVDAASLLRRREAALIEAHERMSRWAQNWSAAVAPIGLGSTASPTAAQAVLGTLSQITTKGGDLAGYERRIRGVESRNDRFTAEVAAILANLTGHDDAAELEPGATVKTLSRRLVEAQGAAAEHKATTEERDERVTELDDAEGHLTEAAATISEMVAAAKVADEAALTDAITRSEEHSDLAGQIVEIETDLRASTGKPIDQIEAEAEAARELDIGAELEDLRGQMEAVDGELTAEATKLGELKKERSLIDSSGKAAEKMLSAQQSLAEVVDHADEFVRIKLARQLLEEQITAYRDENQGPLLARARELFRSLTVDRYTGIDTDTDGKGNPFIIAQKAGDKLLTVDELSTGTRDQLYLALRLAALEQFMERRGPLPLVLDDLFVHFDDERTEAGLSVLDTMADETQVLLFSHHHQVARQAESVISADRLTVHELG